MIKIEIILLESVLSFPPIREVKYDEYEMFQLSCSWLELKEPDRFSGKCKLVRPVLEAVWLYYYYYTACMASVWWRTVWVGGI